MNYKIYALLVAVTVSLIMIGCETNVTEPSQPDETQTLAFPGSAAAMTGDAEISIQDIMDSMNQKLEAEGLDYRVFKAEYITAAESDEMGAEILAKDIGNKQLGSDFVPNDLRRTWSNNLGPVLTDTDDITYAIDQTIDATPLSPGVSAVEATNAIQRAMGTWDAQRCSDLSLTQNDDSGIDIGFIANIFGLGGSPNIVADVQHAGFRDINFGGGVLGVAYTLVFVNAGVPTDIDENGKNDVAFREIYYDPSWFWTVGDFPGVDIETIALHEAGHGLSQAHFGTIFRKKGEITVSPSAVMNAVYLGGEQRSLKGTDKGGHCSNWGQWPNN